MKPTYMRLRQIEFKIQPQREREGVVFSPPTLGEGFRMLSGPEPEEIFTTSPVQDIKATYATDANGFPERVIFRTRNSVYELYAITPPVLGLEPE